MLLATLLLSLAHAEGEEASSDSGSAWVVGGAQAPKGKWPDTAAIVFYGNQVGCTGTLIAPDVVITAGHCIGGIAGVLLNTNDYTSGGEYIAVKKEIEYPNSWATVDVGLLLLDKSSSVEPRVIAQDCVLEEIYDGADVQIVGYGALDIWGNQYGTKLMEATSTIADHDCTDMWRGCNSSVSPGGELGAGGNGVDACFGDSGGPLYLLGDKGHYLVGVTSRSYSNVYAPCEEGGIWGRPDSIIDWIESTSGRTLPKPDCGGDDGGNEDNGGGDDGGGDNGGGDNGGDDNAAPEPYARPILVIEGVEAVTRVHANDPDIDDLHYFEIESQPEFGEAWLTGDGTLTYVGEGGGMTLVTVRVTDDGVPQHSVLFDVEVEVVPRADGGGCSTAPAPAGLLALLLAALLRRRQLSA